MYVFPGRGICRDFFRWTGGISLKGPSPVCNGRQKFAPCLRLPGGTAGVLPESVLATAEAHPPSACRRALAPPQHACPPSACHCEPRSCNREHLPVFSMSLRPTFLQPRTRPSFCMSLRTTSLQPRTRPHLLHVIANHVFATANTYPSSACHCEPVRTLVRQSASPQRNFANWQFLGQICGASRIRPKYCFSFCFTARRTDCPVASLLAMTVGGRPLHPLTPGKFLRTLRAKRPCTRAQASSFSMSFRTSAHT